MSLAQELNLQRNLFSASDINRVENVNERLDEIVACIESSHIERLWLDEPPVTEELGRKVSQVFTSNPHSTSITAIVFLPDDDVAMRDLIPWIASRGRTLAHLTSLEQVLLDGGECTSIQDYDVLFPLLLTRPSLRQLRVSVVNWCDDNVMSVIARYLRTSSIVTFSMCGCYDGVVLSQAAFNFLCDGIVESTLQKLSLGGILVQEVNLETTAESLARAIVQSSSLDEVMMLDTSIRLALLRTKHVKNLDFAFSQIRHDASHLRINRKWKPLLGANIPLGLWPRILEKAYMWPETSHGPVGILFYLLRENPELVPGTTSLASLGKRK